MAKLEDITVGVSVTGLAGSVPVTIVNLIRVLKFSRMIGLNQR